MRELQILFGCKLEWLWVWPVSASCSNFFTSNHASYFDAIVMLACLPPNTRFVAKRELFDAPVSRTIMRKLDYLAVDRMDLSKGLEATKQIEKMIAWARQGPSSARVERVEIIERNGEFEEFANFAMLPTL